MVNTVPPGLIVTCRPAAPWLAWIVTVTVWPAASVPEDGSTDMWPWPADTVIDQSTVPPCAVSVICVLPAPICPPGEFTTSVPGEGGRDGVGEGFRLGAGVGVDDGGAVVWLPVLGRGCDGVGDGMTNAA